MPTPVSAARQCLTDEAARFLDDAVSVARRRCHAQTTSLHAVSALLSLPTSTLRDACSRARSCAYPPRLQFRALDLSVGVSLDRLPSSKPTDEPPVSNSLMAAIKRSQANQRRHPESFHLHQIHNQQQTPSILKVELKYFILSILDDPIVSRVFGEAGFRSCDIKLAIMHPPLTHHASRFARSARCPPIFLCNLTDSDVGHRNFPFPFTGGYGNGDDDDANCRRIGEVLVRKTGRNPLLIGVYAADALRSFTDCVQRCKSDVLPGEISGLRVICIEKEVSEFVSGNGSREKMGFKFEEVFGMVQQCSGPGMVVKYGELSDFLNEEDDENDRMSFVVSQLMALLKLYSGKVWLIGAVGTYEMHEKFLAKFPAIEKDWDLHLLPITYKPMVDEFGAKSSLMGSFVPFGGFFPSPSNFPSQLSSPNQSFTRCHQCTEKYEQEVAAIWKAGLITVPGRHSESSLHMPMTELDPKSKEFDVYKTRDDRSTLSDKVIGLQKKWNEICRLHQRQLFPKLDISQTRHGTSFESTRFVLDHERSGEEPSSVTGERSVIIANSCLSIDLQNNLNTKQGRQISEISDTRTDNFQSKIVSGASPPGIEAESLRIFSKSVVPKGCLQSDKLLPSPLISVTTDLGLGTLYATASENKRKVSELESHQVGIQHLTGSNPTEFSRPSNYKSGQSPGWSDLNAGRPLDIREFKSLWNALNEKVSWQGKATSSIVETILRCRSGGGRRRSSLSSRGDIWLTFLGPDMIGKRKISLALAELMFGSRENLILVDFGAQDRDRRSNSLFDCKGLDGYDERFRGRYTVDYVAGELRKKPSSVVLLENVDKADVLARSCLSQAITTGKFPDPRGTPIAINNTIFVTTSTNKKIEKSSNVDVDEQTEFSEERILTAKKYQMQIRVGGFASDVNKHNDMNVRIMSARGSSNLLLSKKRKLDDESTGLETNSEMQKKASSSSMSFLDLNLPVEEVEEGSNDGDCDSDSISEGSETWLDEFLEQVDEKIMFKPYDFDETAEKLVKEINLQFRRVFGNEVVLEIDYKTIVQILAANWVSEKKRGMEEWIEVVLHRSFVEAEQKYQMGSGSVMKLVCKEGVVEDQAAGIFLPARIKLN